MSYYLGFDGDLKEGHNYFRFVTSQPSAGRDTVVIDIESRTQDGADDYYNSMKSWKPVSPQWEITLLDMRQVHLDHWATQIQVSPTQQADGAAA